MERTLVNSDGKKRHLCREGEVVSLYDGNLVELEETAFRTELTAKAYEAFWLHYLAELGYKPE